jgi:hypothetical protein
VYREFLRQRLTAHHALTASVIASSSVRILYRAIVSGKSNSWQGRQKSLRSLA